MEPATRSPGDLDSRHLADIMKVLANPVRIELLKTLRSARTLGEIRVLPVRRDTTARPGRPINRVTTRQHLDRLLELGVVRRVRRVRDGRALDHYLVHHAQLFALLEEMRQMMALRPEEEVLDGTLPGPTPTPLSAPGAKLALVQGAAQGRVFSLEGEPEGGRWIVGRRRGLAACLDYDPYVSLENAEVARRGAGFEVRDLGSRNGTWLNWERLPAEAWRPLAGGDLLGVGRSVLVFRDR